jgi:chemotaxis signal transduction protein
MANNEEKSGDALFRDPFEDIETDGLGQEETEKKDVPKVEVMSKTGARKRTRAKAKSEKEKKLAAEAEDKPEAEKTKKAKPRTRKRTVSKAKSKATSDVQKKAKAKDKIKPTARKKDSVEAKPEVEEIVAETEVQPETEPAFERDGVDASFVPVEAKLTESTSEPKAVSEVVAVPDEEANRLLDELIATIDGEVEEAFRSGAMAGLTPEDPSSEIGEEQHVIFSLAGTEYAAHIDNVIEIGQPLDITPVPNVPDWVLGVANLRGDIISVVDMRAFLGMEQTSYGQDRRMMVTQASGEDLNSAFIVDRVSGIRYLAVDRIGEPTAPIEDNVAHYLRGVYEHDDRLLVVLDFDRLLLSPEMRQF